MIRIASILAAFALTASPAVAGDQRTPVHGEKLLGHDGKQWVMEGCAAYPVTTEAARQQSKPVPAPNSWTRPAKKLAQSKRLVASRTATE
jgi:hypothetical protein